MRNIYIVNTHSIRFSLSLLLAYSLLFDFKRHIKIFEITCRWRGKKFPLYQKRLCVLNSSLKKTDVSPFFIQTRLHLTTSRHCHLSLLINYLADKFWWNLEWWLHVYELNFEVDISGLLRIESKLVNRVYLTSYIVHNCFN